MENLSKPTTVHLSDNLNPILILESYDESSFHSLQSNVSIKWFASSPNTSTKKFQPSPLDSLPPEDKHKF